MKSSAGRRFSRNIIPYFFQKLGKMSQNLSSTAVVIGALRVNVHINIEINVCFIIGPDEICSCSECFPY